MVESLKDHPKQIQVQQITGDVSSHSSLLNFSPDSTYIEVIVLICGLVTKDGVG